MNTPLRKAALNQAANEFLVQASALNLSRRAQYGLVAIAALLGFEGLSRIGDAVEAKRAERKIAEVQAARIDRAENLALWRERAAAAAAAKSQWDSLFWSGATFGIAGAELQQALTRSVRSSKLIVQKIDVSPEPVALAGGESGLRFTFSGRADNAADVARFLGATASQTPAMFTDELSLRFMQNKSVFFSISGVAPVRAAPPTDANAGAQPATEAPVQE